MFAIRTRRYHRIPGGNDGATTHHRLHDVRPTTHASCRRAQRTNDVQPMRDTSCTADRHWFIGSHHVSCRSPPTYSRRPYPTART